MSFQIQNLNSLSSDNYSINGESSQNNYDLEIVEEFRVFISE